MPFPIYLLPFVANRILPFIPLSTRFIITLSHLPSTSYSPSHHLYSLSLPPSLFLLPPTISSLSLSLSLSLSHQICLPFKKIENVRFHNIFWDFLFIVKSGTVIQSQAGADIMCLDVS